MTRDRSEREIAASERDRGSFFLFFFFMRQRITSIRARNLAMTTVSAKLGARLISHTTTKLLDPTADVPRERLIT